MVESMPVNQSWRHLRGVDAALDWRETTGLGDFSANLLWSHTFWAQRRMRAPGTLHDVWRDASDNLAFRSNLRGSVGWQGQGRWSGNLFGVRYGSLPRADGSGRLPAQLLWNANLGRRISERTVLTLFVNNLLDVAPPRDSSNTVYPYYYAEVYSAMGREFALQLDYNFD
jgi:outer membrane receptor protein involved in Fe transport